MIRGKGTHVITRVLVLLFTAGSASALPTFPVCLRGANTLAWMTDNPTFDPVLIVAPSRGRESITLEALAVAAEQTAPGAVSIGDPGTRLMMAQETSVQSNPGDCDAASDRTTCPIPSPGTLLLGAVGAFLVGALRIRRML
jgi:hypothetical protein